MRDRAQVERQIGAYSDTELHAIAATLIEAESADVCQVAAVVVLHAPGGGHTMKVANSASQEPAELAALLRHAADHLHGGCATCRARNARGGNHAGT